MVKIVQSVQHVMEDILSSNLFYLPLLLKHTNATAHVASNHLYFIQSTSLLNGSSTFVDNVNFSWIDRRIKDWYCDALMYEFGVRWCVMADGEEGCNIFRGVNAVEKLPLFISFQEVKHALLD